MLLVRRNEIRAGRAVVGLVAAELEGGQVGVQVRLVVWRNALSVESPTWCVMRLCTVRGTKDTGVKASTVEWVVSTMKSNCRSSNRATGAGGAEARVHAWFRDEAVLVGVC